MKIELTTIQQANTFVQTVVLKYIEFAGAIDPDKSMIFEIEPEFSGYKLTFSCISKLGRYVPNPFEKDDLNEYFTTHPITLKSFATMMDILDIENALDQIDSFKIIK